MQHLIHRRPLRLQDDTNLLLDRCGNALKPLLLVQIPFLDQFLEVEQQVMQALPRRSCQCTSIEKKLTVHRRDGKQTTTARDRGHAGPLFLQRCCSDYAPEEKGANASCHIRPVMASFFCHIAVTFGFAETMILALFL